MADVAISSTVEGPCMYQLTWYIQAFFDVNRRIAVSKYDTGDSHGPYKSNV